MKLNALGNGLSQLNPHAVLSRGYAIVTNAEGKTIRNISSAQEGSSLTLSFAQSSAAVTVNKVVATTEAD